MAQFADHPIGGSICQRFIQAGGWTPFGDPWVLREFQFPQRSILFWFLKKCLYQIHHLVFMRWSSGISSVRRCRHKQIKIGPFIWSYSRSAWLYIYDFIKSLDNSCEILCSDADTDVSRNFDFMVLLGALCFFFFFDHLILLCFILSTFCSSHFLHILQALPLFVFAPVDVSHPFDQSKQDSQVSLKKEIIKNLRGNAQES